LQQRGGGAVEFMMPEIHFWRCELQSAIPLNARTRRRIHEGALLRVGDGFGCVHPWPELGDAPLADQLALLRENRTTALTKQTLACCAADGAARREARRLFAGLAIPPSHATLPEFPSADECAALSADGFSCIKIKAPNDCREMASMINELAAELDRLGLPLSLRLDFNATLTPNAVLDFAWTLTKPARRRIEFLEDPCPYDPVQWRAVRRMAQIPLALDRCEAAPEPDSFDVRVIKPALQEIPASPGRMLVTSYMDHPLGQMFAAWQAALHFDGCDACGLLTHALFEPNPFSERLRVSGPLLHPPKGTGLGFDDLLEGLPWKRLT